MVYPQKGDGVRGFHSLSKFLAVPDASLGFRIDAVVLPSHLECINLYGGGMDPHG